mmetsp:Transcript_26759/g.54761  ORF Transcript_26759/g.54761 Transcript_26759/m.54761 type:complete len:305 (-) Transcript_26759:109-1023(-)|eukprot:CAMPEP_0183300064 /NCGR_PEP_ID=MMETSP0160_2-20130417/6610_1 /TAXON_ID=2839 ORGANISM="Odontella Sinensis, Strain Grunow 1884" /NCGR_SAMPLE_ID=MMETSP0160_2 /ASSEMBLY_ACC=CAM_ASM_000250 /LENGTH=304 /DNA_ID=CAMNT_0025462419 /DNA_START=145 /DNA_END=1059 /DNA_ORIENTATION=+
MKLHGNEQGLSNPRGMVARIFLFLFNVCSAASDGYTFFEGSNDLRESSARNFFAAVDNQQHEEESDGVDESIGTRKGESSHKINTSELRRGGPASGEGTSGSSQTMEVLGISIAIGIFLLAGVFMLRYFCKDRGAKIAIAKEDTHSSKLDVSVQKIDRSSRWAIDLTGGSEEDNIGDDTLELQEPSVEIGHSVSAENNGSSAISEGNSSRELFSFDSQEGEFIEVFVPPGRMGLMIDSDDDGPPVVDEIRDISPLIGHIKIGDKLITVDGEDVTFMSAFEVTRFLTDRSDNPERKLRVFRPPIK